MLGFSRSDMMLAWNLFKMNIRDRYLGTGLGSAWALANPLLMMGIYTYVFGFIFNARLPGAQSTLAYVTWLISGLGPWIAINEATLSATSSVVSASGLVKNMVFKTELLPIAAAMTGVVPLAISLVFLGLLLVADGKPPSWHSFVIPGIILLQFLFVISLGFFLAAIQVFVRDFGVVLPNLMMAILFTSPIFYPFDTMPAALKYIALVNPFYILIEAYRSPLINHELPSLWPLCYVALLSLAFTWLGLKFFRRLKGYFNSKL